MKNGVRKNLKIVVIAGATRKGRKSFIAAKLVSKVGDEMDGVETVLVDAKDYEDAYEYHSDSKFSKLTKEADGFFIVTPEYNHSIPGSLKRLLDSEFENYNHKPVAFAGVSSGPWGGVRAIEALNTIVKAMGMVNIRHDVEFPNVSEIFSDEGKLKDKKMVERIEKVYEELVWMGRVLKKGREELTGD